MSESDIQVREIPDVGASCIPLERKPGHPTGQMTGIVSDETNPFPDERVDSPGGRMGGWPSESSYGSGEGDVR